MMREVYKKYMPRYWREQQEKEFVWATIQNIPDNEFWSAHQQAKQQLLAEMVERARARYAAGQLDAWQVPSSAPFQNPNVLTLGFALRRATYKRAGLLFRDIDRLARILTDPERPVKLMSAGKAHPADEGGKKLIQEIYL